MTTNELGIDIVSNILGDLVYDRCICKEGYSTLALHKGGSHARVWIHEDGSVCYRPAFEVYGDILLSGEVADILSKHEIKTHQIINCPYREDKQ
ncbi:hypothetical protein LCGC14_0383250 [marine sediment metagenome]|uniref:Uncharacterized protein n=1 Tax=marine sediment metagenome TaxID=412755 RepID=A0A0F9VNV2_9ZZZZ